MTPERMRKCWAEVSGTVLSDQIADFGELVASEARREALEAAARVYDAGLGGWPDSALTLADLRALIEEPRT